MKLQIQSFAWHRNGISGAPFHVVLFRDDGAEGSRKVAVMFDAPGHCAVLDIAKLSAGDIANTWRGGHHEPTLRRAIATTNLEGE
jgi:hypothetical protein